MSKIFIGAQYLLALAILTQIYLAGFAASSFDNPVVAFETHRDFGHMIVGLALVVLLLAFVARVPRRLIGLSTLSVGLIVAQMLLGMTNENVTTTSQVMIGIHAINALAIMGVIVQSIYQTHNHLRAKTKQSPSETVNAMSQA